MNGRKEVAMTKTGDKCTLDGWYDGVCEQQGHEYQARFHAGDHFAPCVVCGGMHKTFGGGVVVTWTWARK